MVIEVTVKNVYGEDKVYPVNDNAKLFAAIAGTKTLLHNTIKHAQALGYEIIVSHATQLPAGIR